VPWRSRFTAAAVAESDLSICHSPARYDSESHRRELGPSRTRICGPIMMPQQASDLLCPGLGQGTQAGQAQAPAASRPAIFGGPATRSRLIVSERPAGRDTPLLCRRRFQPCVRCCNFWQYTIVNDKTDSTGRAIQTTSQRSRHGRKRDAVKLSRRMKPHPRPEYKPSHPSASVSEIDVNRI
jgi:hypothetical protein